MPTVRTILAFFFFVRIAFKSNAHHRFTDTVWNLINGIDFWVIEKNDIPTLWDMHKTLFNRFLFMVPFLFRCLRSHCRFFFAEHIVRAKECVFLSFVIVNSVSWVSIKAKWRPLWIFYYFIASCISLWLFVDLTAYFKLGHL